MNLLSASALLPKKNYDVNDVAAGREYVKAYVEYIHFVERLHEATTAQRLDTSPKPSRDSVPEVASTTREKNAVIQT